MLVKLKALLGWLTKKRQLGKSPLVNTVGFAAIVIATLIFVLSARGVDVTVKIKNAYSFYFNDEQQQTTATGQAQVKPSIKQSKKKAALTKTINSNQASDNNTRLEHANEKQATPRIALHPLNDSQYRQQQSNGKEMSELVTSMLVAELGTNETFELLDRSHVSALLDEKTLMLANEELDSDQATLKKLPISDYTLVGSLFSIENTKSYSLKLVHNNTGQILGTKKFSFTLDNIQTAIQQSTDFLKKAITDFKPTTKMFDTGEMDKIAIGHFVDISDGGSHSGQGRIITEYLIQQFVKNKNYFSLSRTQMFPLIFEEYLHTLQYTDEHRQSVRQNANYLIYGKYRANHSDPERPISIYLYIDRIKYGRELITLKAKDWAEMPQLIENALTNYLPNVTTNISENNIAKSKELFLKALRAKGTLYLETVLNGTNPPDANTMEYFATNHKGKNNHEIRALINQSLALNPHNPLSKLAFASFFVAEGKIAESEKLLNEVLTGRDLTSVDLAYTLLQRQQTRQNQQSKSGYIIPTTLFDGVMGVEKSDEIIDQLIRYKYLPPRDQIGIGYGPKKLDLIFGHSHSLHLGNINPDIAIQVFEKLRSYRYDSGVSNWDKYPIHKYNSEAFTHFDSAKAVSHIDAKVENNASLPIITFDGIAERELANKRTVALEVVIDEIAERELANKRTATLEVAIDGFSSAAYLDKSYLEAEIFLGKILCQEEIRRCGSGNVIYSWVVDHEKLTNLYNQGNIYRSLYNDVENRDALIFLAADAVNRVSEANLTTLFQHTLARENYLVDKHQKKVAALLLRKKPLHPEKHNEQIVNAYAQLIRAHCFQLSLRKLELKEPGIYIGSVLAMTEFVEKNPETRSLQNQLMSEIKVDYPAIFPYFNFAENGKTPASTTKQLVDGIYVLPEVAYTTLVSKAPALEVPALTQRILDQPENTLIRMFADNYIIDANKTSAVKGFWNKPTAGPIQDQHFSTKLTNTRKLSVVKEQLFEKGYLTVTSVPINKPNRWEQLKRDFPDYTSLEISGISSALAKSEKISIAGYVQIHHNRNGSWQKPSTLIPDDAIDNRRFGTATAVYNEQALICDIKDGVYYYKLINTKWVQQKRINAPCKTVTMNNNWAAVSANDNIYIYKNESGFWTNTQILIPDDYLSSKNRNTYADFFGSAMSFQDNTLFIGNPGGGANNRGEVYRFQLSGNQWQLHEVLLPDDTTRGFGASITTNPNHLIIGAPETGEYDTSIPESGVVLIYKRNKTGWKFSNQLVASDRQKHTHFGSRVFINNGAQPSILIGSKDDVYQFPLTN